MTIRGRTAAIAVAATVATFGAGAGATPEVREHRLQGPDRYTTARAVAEATFGEATIALLANGRSFSDALASTYLSGATGSPLLLTEHDTLPPGIFDTFEELGIEGALVVGGTAAVSDGLIRELEDAGYTTSRLSGRDRYETARRASEVFAKEAIGELDAGRAAIVATGATFADALAAGPMSSSQGLPILLTTPGSLHPEARAGLEQLEIEQVVVVGGTAAVSEAVVAEIDAMGIAVRRVAGDTRQGTARHLAELTKDLLRFPVDRVLLARGDDFADALGGGTRGGWLRAPILLVDSPSALGEEARAFIAANSDSVAVIDVLGGAGAVGPAAAAARGQ